MTQWRLALLASQARSAVNMDAGCVRDTHNMNVPARCCGLCGTFHNLSMCAGCKSTWYCCREHQKAHWKQHKPICKSLQAGVNTATRGSRDHPSSIRSEQVSAVNVPSAANYAFDTGRLTDSLFFDNNNFAISQDSSQTQQPTNSQSQTFDLNPYDTSNIDVDLSSLFTNTGSDPFDFDIGSIPSTSSSVGTVASPPSDINRLTGSGPNTGTGLAEAFRPLQISTNQTKTNMPPTPHNTTSTYPSSAPPPAVSNKKDTKSLEDYVTKCLNDYGICVVDNFLGYDRGVKVLQDVKHLQSDGIFRDGELVSQSGAPKKIRGDVITWVEGTEPHCFNIQHLIVYLDKLIMKCNGRLGQNHINGRTKVGIYGKTTFINSPHINISI